MVRFENLADRFDAQSSLAVKYFDVRRFAIQFYKDANEGRLPKFTTNDEIYHSGNILISELTKQNTYRWKGDDDGTMLDLPINTSPEDHGDEKALEP